MMRSQLLGQFDGVIDHGFTTKEEGGDFAGITKSIGFKPIRLEQIHSSLAYWVDSSQVWGDATKQGDALLTNEKTPICVRTADCLPILIFEPGKKIVAAIHSGWRGLVGGVIESTLGLMQTHGANPSQMHAAIGPGLCQNCFEIGPEVKAVFENLFPDQSSLWKAGHSDRWHVDLKAAANKVLEDAALPPSQIEDLNHCTKCESDQFYSYRSGDKDARMISFMRIK